MLEISDGVNIDAVFFALNWSWLFTFLYIDSFVVLFDIRYIIKWVSYLIFREYEGCLSYFRILEQKQLLMIKNHFIFLNISYEDAQYPSTFEKNVEALLQLWLRYVH